MRRLALAAVLSGILAGVVPSPGVLHAPGPRAHQCANASCTCTDPDCHCSCCAGAPSGAATLVDVPCSCGGGAPRAWLAELPATLPLAAGRWTPRPQRRTSAASPSRPQGYSPAGDDPVPRRSLS